MTRAILDTNLLISGDLVQPGYEATVSSLSWAELGYGVRKAPDELERARRERRLGRLRAILGEGIPFDDAAAEAYGSACGLVLGTGRDVRGRAIDLMIAATAAAHGAAVITRNPKGFIGLEGFVEIIAV